MHAGCFRDESMAAGRRLETLSGAVPRASNPGIVRPRVAVLVMLAMLALTLAPARASVLHTWDLTGAPDATDAPPNAVVRLLGHSASYIGDGGRTLVAHAFYYAGHDPSTPQAGNLYRTAPLLSNGLGVCSAIKTTGAGTSECDTDLDMPLIGDQGTFDFIRLTLPQGVWRPASVTLTVVDPQDQIRIYGSNAAAVDFTIPGNLAHNASSLSSTYTITFDPNQTDAYRYLFVSGNTFATGSGGFLGDDFFRLASLSAVRVGEPPLAALMPIALLFAGAARRRRERRSA